MIKRHSKLAVIVATIAFIIACAPKNIPPDIKPAYTQLQILNRIDELQNLTISLFDSNQISKQRADLIVKFTIVAAESVRNSLTGWQATVKAAWAQLNQLILKPEQGLEVTWQFVDVMIGAL